MELVLQTIRLFPENTPGLVYCITKKEAESLRESLSKFVACAFYHGDLAPETRRKASEIGSVRPERPLGACRLGGGRDPGGGGHSSLWHGHQQGAKPQDSHHVIVKLSAGRCAVRDPRWPSSLFAPLLPGIGQSRTGWTASLVSTPLPPQ